MRVRHRLRIESQHSAQALSVVLAPLGRRSTAFAVDAFVVILFLVPALLTVPGILSAAEEAVNKRLSERMLDRDMTVELTVAAKERLIEVGFDPALGARPLRRAVQHEVEDRLSEKILLGELKSGDHVNVDFVDAEFVFTTTSRDAAVSVGINAAASLGTGPATPDLAITSD